MQQLFAFHAVARDGSLDRGAIAAESLRHARDALASRGLLVLSIEPRGPRARQRGAAPLAPRDLALGLRMLGDLLDSGLSAGRALHAFD
jgi:type II secretory pathway component PulF